MSGKGKATYIKNVILPGFVVSGLTGAITGAAIFFFKWGAEFISAASTRIYGLILENPVFVPVMFVALVGLALAMAFIIKGAPAVAGGGIPTAEGILRGLITFRWLRTFLSMILNSYIAFFAGLPLGNEGPSVLIGTSLGRGTNNLFNRNPAWDRYVMTAARRRLCGSYGGACYGYNFRAGGGAQALFSNDFNGSHVVGSVCGRDKRGFGIAFRPLDGYVFLDGFRFRAGQILLDRTCFRNRRRIGGGGVYKGLYAHV